MPGTLRFDYHHSVAPMMWVLVALSGIELAVTHFLLALWRPWLAAAVSGVTVCGLIWLMVVIRSFRRLPVTIEDDRVVMRAGRIKGVTVPLRSVAGFRDVWTASDLKAVGVCNLALIAYPNVWIDLAPPVAGRRRPVRAVAHELDDPAAFRLAVLEKLSLMRQDG